MLLHTFRYSPSQVPRLRHGLCDQWRIGSASPLQTHPRETIQMFHVWLCQCGGTGLVTVLSASKLVHHLLQTARRLFLFGHLVERLWAKEVINQGCSWSKWWGFLSESESSLRSLIEILGDTHFFFGDYSCHSFLNYLSFKLIAGIVVCFEGDRHFLLQWDALSVHSALPF